MQSCNLFASKFEVINIKNLTPEYRILGCTSGLGNCCAEKLHFCILLIADRTVRSILILLQQMTLHTRLTNVFNFLIWANSNKLYSLTNYKPAFGSNQRLTQMLKKATRSHRKRALKVVRIHSPGDWTEPITNHVYCVLIILVINVITSVFFSIMCRDLYNCYW